MRLNAGCNVQAWIGVTRTSKYRHVTEIWPPASQLRIRTSLPLNASGDDTHVYPYQLPESSLASATGYIPVLHVHEP